MYQAELYECQAYVDLEKPISCSMCWLGNVFDQLGLKLLGRLSPSSSFFFFSFTNFLDEKLKIATPSLPMLLPMRRAPIENPGQCLDGWSQVQSVDANSVLIVTLLCARSLITVRLSNSYGNFSV